MIWDVFRYVAMFLFASLVVQVLSTAWFYWKFSKMFSGHVTNGNNGIIPNHVWTLGIGLCALSLEVVWVNIENLGEGFRPFAVLNPLLFLYMNLAALQIGHFERKRYALARSRLRSKKLHPPEENHG